jgi:hypothetical protein
MVDRLGISLASPLDKLGASFSKPSVLNYFLSRENSCFLDPFRVLVPVDMACHPKSAD